ncbi:manganese efflux pump MntP family protein [Halobacillus salinarum]|uniref:Putative manganese efflux pump MntP n=1 Tax=Halobacillus salinarum TaxID=2932257 RepID=A0ABY4ENY1_9BACI|nr:manganese efflux pump MntP family protein [Halobacillus salinarum]UOQ45344.1 manganese efflux pump MntP family protein [Halobacillus salinarum]
MAHLLLEEITPIILLSFALGMDAFSVALGMGMQAVRLKYAFYAGITVGVFHMIMPGLGIALGQWLSNNVSQWASFAGGFLLFCLGSYTIFACLAEKHSTAYTLSGAGLWLFALSVSIDSFPVGFTLGLRHSAMLISIMAFGIMSMVLTWAGFIVGRRTSSLLGTYSEILGGSILCGLGLYAIF